MTTRFKKGDKVRVRMWDNMVNDFGLLGPTVIDCRFGFLEEMRKHCGKVVTIEAVICGGYHVVEDECGFAWGDDMFEQDVVK